MKETKPILGLAHIGIFTADIERTKHFYTKILPFEIVLDTIEEHPEDNSGVYPLKVCILRCNELYLEVMECSNKGWTADDVDGVFNHVGLRVSNLDQALGDLRAKGLSQDRIGEIFINDQLVPGKSYRSCRIKGYNGEAIGLYEIDNEAYYV